MILTLLLAFYSVAVLAAKPPPSGPPLPWQDCSGGCLIVDNNQNPDGHLLMWEQFLGTEEFGSFDVFGSTAISLTILCESS